MIILVKLIIFVAITLALVVNLDLSFSISLGVAGMFVVMFWLAKFSLKYILARWLLR